MIKKELIKELIVTFQQNLVFGLKERSVEVPVDSGKIVVLKGVRRSGKSSTLFLTIEKVIKQGVDARLIVFLNFDDERLQFSVSDFDVILQAYRELYPGINAADVYFFFDEIQVSDGWEQFVRRVYDNESKNIFISGSNSKLLSSEIATSLRGRTLQYEIFPLSYGEYCNFLSIGDDRYNTANKALLISRFLNYLNFGGFPELVLSDFKFTDRILQEYYHVMLYRDLVERYEIKNLPALKYFIRRILANLTKSTSINKIFNELKSYGINVGKNSLYEWIDHLESVYLFFPLPKYDPSIVKENASDKKYYCIDNGLHKALSTSLSNNLGALLENTVFLWLRGQIDMNLRLYYFKGKHECDFVIASSEKVEYLVQVSYDISGLGTMKREIDGILEASQRLNCDHLFLITSEVQEDIEQNGKVIKVRPAWWACKNTLDQLA